MSDSAGYLRALGNASFRQETREAQRLREIAAEIERLRAEREYLEPLQDWIGQCPTFTEAEIAQTVTDPDALWVQCPRWILEEYYREKKTPVVSDDERA